MKKQVYSKPFNIVFERNYPNLVIGPGVYEKKEDAFENSPKEWINKDLKKIEEIRGKQIFAYKNYSKIDAKNPKKEIEEIQHLIKSKKETEIEINTNDKKINISEKISGINNRGINLENIKIVENIKVSRIIDKITTDTQIKAKDAIKELFSKTEDVYKIEQLLSMGLLGIKKDRIFVPTRWSITSIDDTLGKEIFSEIKNNPRIDSYKFFKYEFYDNIFYVFLIPSSWGFEMIEFKEKQIIACDFEINEPKKEYAYQVTGAYYAARLMVLEYLKSKEKCCKAIVLRDIKPKYTSKGVWVIREALREALKTNETNFFNVDEITKYIIENIGIKEIMKKSEIIKQIKFQKSIFDF